MAAVCASAFTIVHASPASAAESRVPLDPSALEVAIDLQRSEAELAKLPADMQEAVAGAAATHASLNVTLGLLEQNAAERDEIIRLLKLQGVAAYMHSGSMISAPLEIDHVQELGSARRYANAATRVDSAELSRLNQIGEELTAAEQRKRTAYDAAVAEREGLEKRRSTLVAAVEAGRKRLAAIGAIPVLGDAVLNAKQIAGWFGSTGATPKLAVGTTIADVAALFLDEGASEGVRGDLAFAQAIIETGSFGVAAGNNYSGIGVCDSCTGGYGFPTPRDGVRAQIQLLKNYADPGSRASTLAHPPSPALYGADPQKAARTYDSFFLKGKAPLWNLMGGGNWATDPVYAPKVVTVFNQMVAFANAHPELA